MKKQTIAYILIGVAVLAALYYFFIKKNAAPGLGSGLPDTRGSWAAEDDAIYNKMYNRIKAVDTNNALTWINPLVEESYNSGTPAGHNIKGVQSKAGTFLSTMEAINPNPVGTFIGNQSNGNKQLFSDEVMTALWNDFNLFKVKYTKL